MFYYLKEQEGLFLKLKVSRVDRRLSWDEKLLA
jgi:hypothetical protein